MRQGAIITTFLLTLAASITEAGIRTIGPLNPGTAPGSSTPYIGGIAFDGSPNPVVFASNAWTISRVSLTDASVLSAVAVPAPPSNIGGSQLAYDPSTSAYYTLLDNTQLESIAVGSLACSRIGSQTRLFNFDGMAFDSSGTLWIATDNNGGELWKIDKQTGLETLVTPISFTASGSHQITSLAIGPNNQFLVFADSNSSTSDGSFFWVNPSTGATTFAATSPLSGLQFVGAMAYDSSTQSYYGAVEDRSTTPRDYSLVQVTGVPEPACVGIAAVGLLLLRRRKLSA